MKKLKETKKKNYSKSIPSIVIPLKNSVIFPGRKQILDIGRNFSINAIIEACKTEERNVVFVIQKNEEDEEINEKNVHEVGTLCRLIKVPGKQMKAGTVFPIEIEGKMRGKIKNLVKGEFFSGDFCPIEENISTVFFQAMKKKHRELISSLTQHDRLNLFFFEVKDQLLADPIKYIFYIISIISAYVLDRKSIFSENVNQDIKSNYIPKKNINIFEYFLDLQEILSEPKLETLFDRVNSVLMEIKTIFDIQKEINQNLEKKNQQYQRIHMNREKIKILNEMQGDSPDGESQNLKKRIEETEMSDEAKTVALEEYKKLEFTPSTSSEFGVIRNYIEALLSIPWKKEKKINQDIKLAEKILDESHYGLHEVKQKILEYLGTVFCSKGKSSPDILFLCGAPGTGKTTISEAIAKSLGVEFVRLSFAGLFDIAKLMGQMKTYIGAMYGLFIASLIQAKIKNPVILIDEVDKYSTGNRGSPIDSLTVLLDSHQNSAFKDFYIDVKVDFSRVFFILTGNSIDHFPRYILDRVEKIDIPSYTPIEKLNIVKMHIPKIMEKCGINTNIGDSKLGKDLLEITDSAVMELIENYTREAGVRKIIRLITDICRKFNLKKLKGEIKTKEIVTKENVGEYIKKEAIHDIREINSIGVSRGLAWTENGGADLLIETAIFSGKGALNVTGNLGKVMEESVKVVMNYIRTLELKDKEFFEKNDFSVHFPEGATPKDGPSAGIAIFLSITSSILQQQVPIDIACTGELTLHGNLLKIGGLKEKLLAASRVAKRILLPEENRDTVKKLDKSVIEKLDIHFFKNAIDVKNFVFSV